MPAFPSDISFDKSRSALKFSFSPIFLNTVSDRFLKSPAGLFLLLVFSLYFGHLVSNSSMPLNLSFAKQKSVFRTVEVPEDPGHLPLRRAIHSLAGTTNAVRPLGSCWWLHLSCRASFLQLSLPLEAQPFGTFRQNRVNDQALHPGRPEHHLCLVDTAQGCWSVRTACQLPAAAFCRDSWRLALTRGALEVGEHLRGRPNAHLSAYFPGVAFSLGFCPLNLGHFHNPQLQPRSPREDCLLPGLHTPVLRISTCLQGGN